MNWPDPDRRDAALERVALRLAGVATENRSSRFDAPRASTTYRHMPPRRTAPTEGELRVVEAMSHGLTADQAGELLHISPHTVKAHLRHAAQIMAAKNTVHLVALCLRADLIH